MDASVVAFERFDEGFGNAVLATLAVETGGQGKAP
jgi:hypothetical protein